MCNLYILKASRHEVRSHFQARDDQRNELAVTKDYVAPGKPGYVVREVSGERLLSVMCWGFPFQGKPVTNVRNYASPFWRSALEVPERRCIVPVTEFQEWSSAPMPDTGKKRAFMFSLSSQPIFAFAGIWRPTDTVSVFSFLTCGYEGDPAAHTVGAIHPMAIPVILRDEECVRWLNADLNDALLLARALPSTMFAVR